MRLISLDLNVTREYYHRTVTHQDLECKSRGMKDLIAIPNSVAIPYQTKWPTSNRLFKFPQYLIKSFIACNGCTIPGQGSRWFVERLIRNDQTPNTRAIHQDLRREKCVFQGQLITAIHHSSAWHLCLTSGHFCLCHKINHADSGTTLLCEKLCQLQHIISTIWLLPLDASVPTPYSSSTILHWFFSFPRE